MTNETEVVEVTEVQDNSVHEDVALAELVAQLESLNETVNAIVRLRSNNVFRFLSKPTRNTLIYGMLEQAGVVEDAAKAAFRSIKKNKRVRLPEEVADALIAVSTGLKPIKVVASVRDSEE
jgi:hypothetical protein